LNGERDHIIKKTRAQVKTPKKGGEAERMGREIIFVLEKRGGEARLWGKT